MSQTDRTIFFYKPLTTPPLGVIFSMKTTIKPIKEETYGFVYSGPPLQDGTPVIVCFNPNTWEVYTVVSFPDYTDDYYKTVTGYNPHDGYYYHRTTFYEMDL